ncbi:nuclear pore complex protein NUP58-like [Dioscorea cayenensis subsp. rotundata]|uniref:Nuclear pore complex protein NUP58-like n=1 Tax=Dioscorea cayennensis subsp. rotundata TaxID=55577 RepID=A0AB40AQC7_DIOCR|nr:nuclear pore complex protein NUP58-like [Dioscorea cayenensis subsp. rotundata]
MQQARRKRRVTFASSPTTSGHGSGAAPPENRGAHGGDVPMEESSGTSVPMEESSRTSDKKQQKENKQRPQRQVVIEPKYLYKLDGSPAEYQTKFEKLHPISQQLVLEIQKRIREYKDESRSLDEFSCLYDSLGSGRCFEDDARYFNQQIRGLCIAHQKEHILAEELRDVSMKILRATDDAVRSYTELRNKFHLPSSIRASSVHTSTQMAGLAGIYSAADQPSMPFPAASGFPFMIARPSSFMLKTLARFDQYLTKISQQIVELEQLVQPTSEFSSSSVSSLQSIPRIMSNVHDFFIHVAAKVEKLHQHLNEMNDYRATGAVLRR